MCTNRHVCTHKYNTVHNEVNRDPKTDRDKGYDGSDSATNCGHSKKETTDRAKKWNCVYWSQFNKLHKRIKRKPHIMVDLISEFFFSMTACCKKQ